MVHLLGNAAKFIQPGKQTGATPTCSQREQGRKAGTRLDEQPKPGKDLAMHRRGRPPEGSGGNGTAIAVDVVEGHDSHVQNTINHHLKAAAATKTSAASLQVFRSECTEPGHREREQGGERRCLPLAEGDAKRRPQESAKGRSGG